MQLVEEGKIDLKQDITHYMPDVKITNNTGTPVTVEHLLTHTTGFDFTDDYSLPQRYHSEGRGAACRLYPVKCTGCGSHARRGLPLR